MSRNVTMNERANDATQAEPRTNRGHFQRGNTGGPGNPFARQMALLRKAALEAANQERMRTVMDTLYQMAVDRNLAAMKLWLQYTMGKPTDAVDCGGVECDEADPAPASHEVGASDAPLPGGPESEVRHDVAPPVPLEQRADSIEPGSHGVTIDNGSNGETVPNAEPAPDGSGEPIASEANAAPPIGNASNGPLAPAAACPTLPMPADAVDPNEAILKRLQAKLSHCEHLNSFEMYDFLKAQRAVRLRQSASIAPKK